jgi:Tfp pilus assembly protein PilW
MTLVELSIGLAITALVIGALSALWFAVAETWRQSSSSQGNTLRTAQVVTRLEATFRQARYVCQWTPGKLDDTSVSPASCFIWRSDFWNAAGNVNFPNDFKTQVSDGLAQVGELALIEYDPTARRVYLYQPKDPTAMTATERTAAGTVWAWADLSKSSNLSVFKTLSYVEKRVFSEKVSGAEFNVPATPSLGRPMVEFTVKLTDAGTSTIAYSMATLRAASAQPL